MKTIAIYLRVSVEDKKKGESESISNQRDLLKQYIARDPELSCCQVMEFVDDGYSGTNFERPQVKKMLDMAGNDIKTIIVKDFSRFGRSLVEVGNYLDIVFPFLGVRFIAVNENYDSDNNKGATSGIDVGLKSLIYEMYSKDLSRKSKASREILFQKGQYVCGFAPFGFMKSTTEKNKLIPNPETAPIVQRIYEMALTGMKVVTIAKILNEEQIPTPRMFREKYNQFEQAWDKKGIDYLWDRGRIYRILRDERFTGRMVARRRVSVAVGSGKKRNAHEHEIIYCDNAHESIISHDDWLKVQELFPKQTNAKANGKPNSPLTGLLKCGICNHNMTHIIKAKNPFFKCITFYRMENCTCKGNRVVEKEILNELLEEIRTKAPTLLSSKSTTQGSLTLREMLEKQTQQYQQQLKQIDRKKGLLFEKLADGEISTENFSLQTKLLNGKQESIESESSEALEKLRNLSSKETTGDTKDVAKELRDVIEYVAIYPDKPYKIVWK